MIIAFLFFMEKKTLGFSSYIDTIWNAPSEAQLNLWIQEGNDWGFENI